MSDNAVVGSSHWWDRLIAQDEAAEASSEKRSLRERLRDSQSAEPTDLEILGRKAKKERAKRLLEKSFKGNKYPKKPEKSRLASITFLSMKQVDGWFKRRRQVQNAEDVEDSWYDDAVA